METSGNGHKFSVIPFWQLSRSIISNWSCDGQTALMLAVPRRDFHPAQEEISGTRCLQGRDTLNPTLFTPGSAFSPSNLLQELIFPLEEGKQRSCFNYHSEQRILNLRWQCTNTWLHFSPSLIPVWSTGCSWAFQLPSPHPEHSMPLEFFCSKVFRTSRRAGCPIAPVLPWLCSAARLWFLQPAAGFIAGEMQCSDL